MNPESEEREKRANHFLTKVCVGLLLFLAAIGLISGGVLGGFFAGACALRAYLMWDGKEP